MTHRPSRAPLGFPREHQLPPSTASQGIIAASASGANSRITKVEEDIHGLRHDVAGLRHQIDRLDQGSLSTQMSLSLLLENAGFTKEKIQERMAKEQAALSAAREDPPSVPSSSLQAQPSPLSPHIVDATNVDGTPAPQKLKNPPRPTKLPTS